jgi:hypothetical protein
VSAGNLDKAVAPFVHDPDVDATMPHCREL